MWRGKEVWVYAIVLINAWSISVYLLADGDDHCRKPARVFCVQASTGDFYDLPWLICCGSYHFCIYYQDKGHAKSRCNRGMSYKAIILRCGICSVKNLKTMILVWICYIDDFYVCWNFTINRHNLMYLDFFFVRTGTLFWMDFKRLSSVWSVIQKRLLAFRCQHSVLISLLSITCSTYTKLGHKMKILHQWYLCLHQLQQWLHHQLISLC